MDVAKVVATIEEACRKAGRDTGSVRLLGVTKQVPTEIIRKAVVGGLRLFGENRVQEAREKVDEGAYQGATLCLIGHLQSNKVSHAARIFDEVHSVDSAGLAFSLAKASLRHRPEPLPVLIEVNAGEDPAKFGVLPADAIGLVRAVMDTAGLALRGLMTVAPGHGDEALSRAAFRRLRQLRDEMLNAGIPEGCLRDLSMGMSADYRVAIEEGSTIVRLGTALFGPRR